jgi:GNAT superfamily N-acetyltransferase
VAYHNNEPIGCGCFKTYADGSAEIKRMFVDAGERNRGVASEILKELCKWAAEEGFERVILETGLKQPEAIRLYTKGGFKVIPNYPPYVGMEQSVCMEKRSG